MALVEAEIVMFPDGFWPKDFCEPNQYIGNDGYWYFTVFGSFGGKGGLMRHYAFKWRSGEVAQKIPLAQYTNARGSLGVGWYNLYSMSFQNHLTDPANNPPQLIYQRVPGYQKPDTPTKELILQVLREHGLIK